MKNTKRKNSSQKHLGIIITLMIIAMLSLMALAGCARTEEPDDVLDETPWTDENEADPSAELPETIEPTPNPQNHFTPIDDIVVARVNGINIYERDVIFELHRAKGPLLLEYFELFSEEWDEEIVDAFMGGLMTGAIDSDLVDFDRILRDDQTFGQLLLEEAARLAAEFKVYLGFAQDVGIEITPEGMSDINIHIDDLIWDHGEELETLLREDGIRGTSHLAEIYANHWILDNLIFTLMTEPEAFAYFEEYMAEAEEECDAYERAAAILERINDGEDFDILMFTYSEDEDGLAGNPDGYTFAPWQMVPEFTEGTEALEIGGISGLVRSGFGYHIILRVEPDPDNVLQGLDIPEEDLLGAKHILILTKEDDLEERMLEAIFIGFEELTSDIDVEFLPAIWDVYIGW